MTEGSEPSHFADADRDRSASARRTAGFVGGFVGAFLGIGFLVVNGMAHAFARKPQAGSLPWWVELGIYMVSVQAMFFLCMVLAAVPSAKLISKRYHGSDGRVFLRPAVLQSGLSLAMSVPVAFVAWAAERHRPGLCGSERDGRPRGISRTGARGVRHGSRPA